MAKTNEYEEFTKWGLEVVSRDNNGNPRTFRVISESNKPKHRHKRVIRERQEITQEDWQI